MKKKWIFIGLVALVLLIIAGVVAVKIWFTSPGVRTFGKDLHVEMQKTGYVIDPKTGKVTGQTPVTVNGSSNSKDPSVFEGELLVLGYQNFANSLITSTKSVEDAGKGFYAIHHFEECTADVEENNVVQEQEFFCDYFYVYYVYPEKQDFLTVVISDFSTGEDLYVVCADSEAEALEEYAWFLENRPE